MGREGHKSAQCVLRRGWEEFWGKSISGRGIGKCKDLEVGMSLVCPRSETRSVWPPQGMRREECEIRPLLA